MATLSNVIPFRAEGHNIEFAATKPFDRDARDAFTKDEMSGLLNFLAARPCEGRVIRGTGGIRKLRWGAKSKGKRGGARIIYYFRDLNAPLFLLAVYLKGEADTLTRRELKAFEAKIALIVERACWTETLIMMSRHPA